MALTNGTSNSGACVALDRQQLTGRRVQHLGDSTEFEARRGPHPKTFELVVVVGVRLVDGRQVR